MANIIITSGYTDFLDQQNSMRTAYQVYNGEEAKSDVVGKDMSTSATTTLGWNVGDTLAGGTEAEVIAGTKDITNETADNMVSVGFANYV